MKLKVLGYWATTTAIALETLAGGVTDLIHGRTGLVTGEPVVQVVAHEGYPLYVLTILGVWKQLGASPCWCQAFLGSRSGRMLASSLN
jgi:hypothetical protein